MKSDPLPENSIVLRFVAPSAAAAASSVVLASCARAATAHRPAMASAMIRVFFIAPPALKRILECQLNNARAYRRTGNLSRTPAAQRLIGKRELRVIEAIEKFCPELHRLTLSDTRRF